ncbi:hypothetical protein MTR_4g091430 [Medicago truncatula]|uniref:Uncharacterized protein n=1 Tax=Medicago truncatula TaxID=3880 RepID=G7JRW8_MEDTR|nr:hypothetical protein MTR_4g091430 [Medicago truncatula]
MRTETKLANVAVKHPYTKEWSFRIGRSVTSPPTYPTHSIKVVTPLVLRIFTENSISPGPCRRQRGSRYTIRAGRYLCDKEFRYLRKVRVTIAVYRGFHSKLITLLLPTFQHRAGVRLYTSCYHLAESCVFNKQSLPPGMCRFPNQKIGDLSFPAIATLLQLPKLAGV